MGGNGMRRTVTGAARRVLLGSTLAAAAWAAGALTATSAAAQEADGRSEWSGRLGAGDHLDVRGITGSVRATLAPTDRAEVVATRRGRPSDFDEVEVRVVEERGRVVVCAVYHPHEAGEGCGGRDGGDHDHGGRRHDIDVRVDFEVRVPAGVDFSGSMVSGDVVAEGLRGDAEVSSVSGDVRVSTSGVARASTVSGRVDVEMGSLDWDRLRFETVSGDIRVALPADVDADIDFSSLSGDFHSDLALDAVRRDQGRWVGGELSARLGRGGRRLTFRTVSGDVRLRASGTVGGR